MACFVNGVGAGWGALAQGSRAALGAQLGCGRAGARTRVTCEADWNKEASTWGGCTRSAPTLRGMAVGKSIHSGLLAMCPGMILAAGEGAIASESPAAADVADTVAAAADKVTGPTGIQQQDFLLLAFAAAILVGAFLLQSSLGDVVSDEAGLPPAAGAKSRREARRSARFINKRPPK